VILWDTAGERAAVSGGERDPGDEVERAGQRLARRQGERAGLVLWLGAPGDSSPAPPGAVRIVSRSEGPGEASGGEPRIAALEDPAGAARTVERVFRSHFDLPRDAWVAGAAVPFEPALLEDLRSLIGRHAAREAVLGPWLAGRPASRVVLDEPDGCARPSADENGETPG
jgi:hypothetical protein